MKQSTSTLLAAIIGATGAVGAGLVQEWVKGSRYPIEAGQASNLPSEIDSPSKSSFNSWKTLKEGIVYKAESNGFVVIASGGNTPAKNVDILSGSSPDKLLTRSRMGAVYSGAIAPVSDGEYWLVRRWPDDKGTVDVQWKSSK